MEPVFNCPPDLSATVGARMLAARILSPRPIASRACTVARATPSVTYFKTKKLVVSRHSSHKFLPTRRVTTRHSASNKSPPPSFSDPSLLYLSNPLLARAPNEISLVDLEKSRDIAKKRGCFFSLCLHLNSDKDSYFFLFPRVN